jgi:heptosyltransferase-2/heptosyltransferase-3
MIPAIKRLARQGLILAAVKRAPSSTVHRPSSRIRRILVIRPDHLGDLLFATPALRLLRETFPRAHITGAVGPWGRSMWARNPDLDALVTVPFTGIVARWLRPDDVGAGGREREGRGWLRELLKFPPNPRRALWRWRESGPLGSYALLGRVARSLARYRYDLGIVLRYDHWWGAALLWAMGVPRRWGYGTPGMGAWLTHKAPYTPGRHEVEQDYRLVEACARSLGQWRGITLPVERERGVPPLRPPAPVPPAQPVAQEWLAHPRRAAIHPGTGAANKLWTIEGWAEVISRLRAEEHAVALTGAPGERALVDAIVAAVGARYIAPNRGEAPLVDLAGQTGNLNELAWVYEQAEMVLGVDSGPLHIAAALDRPTLHMYGPSDEAVWGPWGDPERHRPLRAPGTRPTMRLEVRSTALEGGDDMRGITVEMVMAEISELLRYTG